jgi:hypothetical protein
MAKRDVDVADYLAALEHPRKPEVVALRRLILAADRGITERIKWNAPSFGVGGDDRVTMRLAPRGQVQLVFHRGAKVITDGFTFADPTGWLVWAAPDRATLTVEDAADLKANGAAIAALVVRWMKATT